MSTGLKTKGRVLIVEDEYVVAYDLQMILEKASFSIAGIAASVEEAMSLVATSDPGIVLLDILLRGEQTGIDLAIHLQQKNIPFVFLSANSNYSILEMAKATKPDGFLVKPFRERDVLVALDIALYRSQHRSNHIVSRMQLLQADFSGHITSSVPWHEKMKAISLTLQHVIPFDFISIGVIEEDYSGSALVSFYRTGRDEYQVIQAAALMQSIGISQESFRDCRISLISYGPQIYSAFHPGQEPTVTELQRLLAKKYGFRSHLFRPYLHEGKTFVLSLYSKIEKLYVREDLQLLSVLQPIIQLAIDRLAAPAGDAAKPDYDTTVNRTGLDFPDIVGSSTSMTRVLELVRKVALMDSSVLLLGESGTGKELIADSIHRLSARRKGPIIKINCAVLPVNLIESELFGHEKGSFTGATEKRIGKFELAHGGTIFLDEIGELPLELQPKLLRVLQEREFERIGGGRPIQVDVRIVAATNRNLEQEISAGRFRLDLYYRLNVFPIDLPALRDRPEDIPALARFFGQKISKRIGRQHNGFSESAIKEMMNYSWPGNIRELENVTEQAIIMHTADGPTELGRILTPMKPAGTTSTDEPKTLQDVKALQDATERSYLLSVLKSTNGRVRGPAGAAAILNMKPTTLESRMERLGIRRSLE